MSGPSGCGKTTLCRRLLRRDPNLVRSISLTTRLPRRDEKRNRDYIYITKEEFRKEVKRRGLLEHALVFGNYYGTPRKFVSNALNKGKDVILSIDVQGAAQIRRVFKEAVLIFILPPTFDDLKNRLVKRSSDNNKQVAQRLRIAHREIMLAATYDYTVVNDKMEKATGDLISIITNIRGRAKKRRKRS